ncbi:MAG: serine proteinase inhibitor, partial [Bacteroidaceae bacterium]|nr:serine proteinase inhibitor [Bacteroidaceae bacterium]
QTGIHRIFDSNLSQLDKIGKNVFISMMKQKSYIEVNEKGAEMASVSVAGMDMNAAGPIEIKERNLQFFADHPFVYIVSETSTGAVFFIGTYQGKN